MTNALKKELKPVYIKSCFGLQSRFWDVTDGEPCWQVPHIAREGLYLIAIDEAHCIQHW